MRVRTMEFFKREQDAQLFIDDLPANAEPLLIPHLDAEMKARGMRRVWGYDVAYWTAVASW